MIVVELRLAPVAKGASCRIGRLMDTHRLYKWFGYHLWWLSRQASWRQRVDQRRTSYTVRVQVNATKSAWVRRIVNMDTLASLSAPRPIRCVFRKPARCVRRELARLVPR